MFEGVRVLEVAQWTLVPAAACVLADFGAEVVKIEDPVRGDGQRGLAAAGVTPMQGGVNLVMEQTNRGKRSVGLDLRTAGGRAILAELVERSDVFVTNFLPAARRALGIQDEDLRPIRPDLIYVLGNAVGDKGAEAETGGYDLTTYWARGGVGFSFTAPDSAEAVRQRPAFGDKAGAMNLAFGIAAALFRRERTGRGATVEVSLLGTALWQLSSDVVYSLGLGRDFSRVPRSIVNPLSANYRTADGRWLNLTLLESDRWWPELCRHLGLERLLEDPRFSDAAARSDHEAALSEELARVFASASLEEWRRRLADFDGPWSPFQSILEAARDPQAVVNGDVQAVAHPGGSTVEVVAAPVQFDGHRPILGPAPEHGADTEAVLLELGHSWEEIRAWKDAGVVL